MAPRKQSRGASKSTATPKKRVAANGFKLPDPIPAGQIITDMAKHVWVLGRSIGQGGFGEIYLASNDPSREVCDTDKFVVKVEPHSNGPLFTEMHCYMRIAKPDLIETWMKEHKLKRFGMPKYLGSGSFEYNNQKYRFMVMERFGSDLQKILEQHNKKFSFKTVYQIGLEIIDVLEYIHDKGYIHADIKASNLLVGYQKGTENQVFLVDYGLACRYAIEGVHKEYKYDGRKAHDGTIEFTSRDAHIGAHSRRGDLEILGYNLCQWLCSRLPWEDNLTDCDSVAKHKRWYMDNVDKLMDKCFPDDMPIPQGLHEFLIYVASLTFDEKPDYEKCRNILRDGLLDRGYKDDGKLVFMSATPKPIYKKPKLKVSSSDGAPTSASDDSSGGMRKKTKPRMMSAASSASGSGRGRRGRKEVTVPNIVEEVLDVSADMFDSQEEEEEELLPVAVKRGAPRVRGEVTKPAARKRKGEVAVVSGKKSKKLPVTVDDGDSSVVDDISDEASDLPYSRDIEKENQSHGANVIIDEPAIITTPKRVITKKLLSTAKSPLFIVKSPVSSPKDVTASSLQSKSPIVKAKAKVGRRGARVTVKALQTAAVAIVDTDLYSGFDNPTPAMQELIAKKRAKEAAKNNKK